MSCLYKVVEREDIMVVEVLRALGTQIIDVAFQGVSGIDTENIQRQHLFAEARFI